MSLPSVLAQASWIAAPVVGGVRCSAPAPYFRKTFLLEQPVQSARLTITALGIYECEINGCRIGDEIFAPGWTDYRKRVQYQIYDAKGQLHVGENVLGAIVGDGWFCGFLGMGPRQTYGDRPRLLAQLDIRLEDGSTVTVSTDSSWKTTTGPILESDFLMGEIYDARLELGAWSQAGYDEARWLPALLAPPDSLPDLGPRVGPPVRRIEEIKPMRATRITHWNAEPRYFDFGQNFSGRVKIAVRATRGKTLRLRFAEVLNPDGTLYTENLREARCTDYYTCKGGETETWEPRFTFHGFRHLEVYGLAAADFLEVTGIVLHSDTPPTGMFRCSNDLLNQLQHNIVWGQKSNFLEVPTDCPQRDERLGWTGDAQVFIRAAAFNMDVRGFFQKWFRDMRDAQSPEGAIPCVIPSVDPGDGGPAWADAVFICPWTIYRCYGDLEILRDHYDCMAGYMDFLARKKVKDHIRAHPDVDSWGAFGDWLALDGSGRTEGATAKDLIGTAHYANNARIMAQTAELLGKTADANRYRELHGKIAEAFRNRYVTPDGLMAGATQTAYVLALHFDLIPPAARATAARELVRNIERNGMHLATGFVGTPYLLHVLEAQGHLDIAYKLLEQETFPSWLFPVKNGATTIWERWDGWTPEKGFQDKDMNSFNHYAYGAVGDWMVSTVAGLEIAEPGYEKILFKPRPGGTITWAEARLLTPHGETAIRWDLHGETGDLKLDLTVPAGCQATLEAPAGYSAPGQHLGPGRHHLVLGKLR